MASPRPPRGHHGGALVERMAISSPMSTLAIRAAANTRPISAASRRLLATFEGHIGMLWGTSLSADGQLTA